MKVFIWLILISNLAPLCFSNTLINKLPITIPSKSYSEEMWVYLKRSVPEIPIIFYQHDVSELKLESSATILNFHYYKYNTIPELDSLITTTCIPVNLRRLVHLSVTVLFESDSYTSYLYVNGFKSKPSERFIPDPNLPADPLLDPSADPVKAKTHYKVQ